MENTKLLKGVHMKSHRIVLLVFVFVFFSACSKYPGITGKVVDNTTGKPIEGALVVAQWTKKHGFGLTYHELSKITETLTDKEGVFNISGIKDSFVEPPEMIIYKEGYVPAHVRNDMSSHLINSTSPSKWGSNPFEKYVAVIGHANNINPIPFKHPSPSSFNNTTRSVRRNA